MMLKPKQKLWLKTRGDRDEEDVVIDEEGYLCVYMYKGYKGLKLVKIPEEKEISLWAEINRNGVVTYIHSKETNQKKKISTF